MMGQQLRAIIVLAGDPDSVGSASWRLTTVVTPVLGEMTPSSGLYRHQAGKRPYR